LSPFGLFMDVGNNLSEERLGKCGYEARSYSA